MELWTTPFHSMITYAQITNVTLSIYYIEVLDRQVFLGYCSPHAKLGERAALRTCREDHRPP